MPRPLSLPAKLDRFPPIAVRLLARLQRGRKVHALSDQQVAHRSGLPVETVRHVSRLVTWADVDVGTLQAFCRGCGADLDNRRWIQKNTSYMESINGIPKYLTDSPDWSSTFEPLIQIWLKHEAHKAA